jgi:hypothetical protein
MDREVFFDWLDAMVLSDDSLPMIPYTSNGKNRRENKWIS